MKRAAVNRCLADLFGHPGDGMKLVPVKVEPSSQPGLLKVTLGLVPDNGQRFEPEDFRSVQGQFKHHAFVGPVRSGLTAAGRRSLGFGG